MRKPVACAALHRGVFLFLCALLSLAGCSGAAARAAEMVEEQPGAEASAAPEATEGGGSREAEVSDLDRPLAALFAETCEHALPMYQCDECRYEVGVVRVPKRLLANGLLKTVPTIRRPVEAALTLTGEIAFDERRMAEVAPLVSGMVTRVVVDQGQSVRAGQRLVTLKSLDLAEAQGAYLEAESRRTLRQSTYDRQKTLRRAGINAGRELQRAEHELAAATIQVDAARQKLLRLGISYTEVRALLANGMASASGEFALRAPRAGMVLELHARVGELLDPGAKTALVADLSRLWIRANLYERDLPSVLQLRASGFIPALVAVQAFPGEWFRGRVDVIGAVLDEQTRTVTARVELENPDGKLRPGMFAVVSLQTAGQREELVVPSAAVLSDAGRSFVFVHHQDDYFVRRPVVVGADRDGVTVIKLGLEAGQLVVAEGAFLLKSDVLRSKMGAGCAD